MANDNPPEQPVQPKPLAGMTPEERAEWDAQVRDYEERLRAWTERRR